MAWVGKTEKECKQEGLNYEVAKFPWAASGRAIASECAEGMTKLIFDKDTHRIDVYKRQGDICAIEVSNMWNHYPVTM